MWWRCGTVVLGWWHCCGGLNVVACIGTMGKNDKTSGAYHRLEKFATDPGGARISQPAQIAPDSLRSLYSGTSQGGTLQPAALKVAIVPISRISSSIIATTNLSSRLADPFPTTAYPANNNNNGASP